MKKQFIVYSLIGIGLTVVISSCGPTVVVHEKPPVVVQEKTKRTGPPPWAPAHGYRKKVRYYYISDIGVYYDIRTAQFIYWSGAKWAYSTELPPHLASYELHASHIVILDYQGDAPYKEHDKYKQKYPKGYKAEENVDKPNKDNKKNKGNSKGRGKGKQSK